jgi:hypothetical protein
MKEMTLATSDSAPEMKVRIFEVMGKSFAKKAGDCAPARLRYVFGSTTTAEPAVGADAVRNLANIASASWMDGRIA